MEDVRYSKEEIKIFQEALINAIDDLEALWNLKALDKIKVSVILPGFTSCSDDYTNHQWYLIIDNKGIYLYQGTNDSNRSYWFGRRKINGKLTKYTTINEQDIIFLNNFFKIRETVAQKVELAIINKQGNLENAKLLTEKLRREATIEIDLPTTNNQHKIEVIEENGKKVGTITFGGATLKIITDANIEFKSKSETEKIKRK